MDGDVFQKFIRPSLGVRFKYYGPSALPVSVFQKAEVSNKM
jgi:hypothetical protein